MKKTLKQLADNYYFNNYQLTNEEYKQLKSSAYKRIFESKPIDPKRLLTENTGISKKRRIQHFHIGIEKYIINELVDLIERTFKLDLSNSSFGKYNSVKVDQLKQVMTEFKNNNIMSSSTKNYIEQMCNKETVHEILYDLFAIDTY